MKHTDDMALILVPIAQDAQASYLRALPLTQPTAGDGSMSLQLGLPPECATPVAAGGKYPMLKDQNGAWNLLSRALQALQSRYSGEYNASFAAQIGGYPLNAIVSAGTSGAFWVSTTDDNLTTPGADGAAWQSLFSGYATEAWASGEFVGRGASIYDFTPLQLGINKSSGEIWASYTAADGSVKYAFAQIAGDYATNTDLNAEVQRATNVENNLQSGKVAKSGDTMSGGLTIASGSGLLVSADPGGQTNGQPTNYGGITSQAGGRGGAFGFYVQELVGSTFNGVLWLRFSDGTYRYLGMPGKSSRLNDSALGDLAYVSDLANYQPKGNYQPAGDYVAASQIDSGTVTNGWYTRIGSVLTQEFIYQIPGNRSGNGATIPFQIKFADDTVPVVTVLGTDSGQSRSISLANNAPPTNSEAYFATSVHGNSTAGSTDAMTVHLRATGTAA